jgi:hypothetical protein
MKLVCAWCQKVIRGRGDALTHGICPRCASAFYELQFAFMRRLPPAPRPARNAQRRARGTRQRPASQALFPFE